MARTRIPSAHCPRNFKVSYRTREEAKYGARLFVRSLIRQGRIAETLYSYVCPFCRHHHLTRQQRPGNSLAFTPPNAETQRWAMDGTEPRPEPRDLEAERQLHRLPDPAPEPTGPIRQPYANRPRGLRYRR